MSAPRDDLLTVGDLRRIMSDLPGEAEVHVALLDENANVAGVVSARAARDGTGSTFGGHEKDPTYLQIGGYVNVKEAVNPTPLVTIRPFLLQRAGWFWEFPGYLERGFGQGRSLIVGDDIDIDTDEHVIAVTMQWERTPGTNDGHEQQRLAEFKGERAVADALAFVALLTE